MEKLERKSSEEDGPAAVKLRKGSIKSASVVPELAFISKASSPKADAASDPKQESLEEFVERQKKILATAMTLGSDGVAEEIAECVDEDLVSEGWTALFMAVDAFEPRVVELLLQARADVHEGISGSKITPLHLAAAAPMSEKLVVMLLEARADPNRLDNKSLTPLHLAAYYNSGEAERAKQLIIAQADVNMPAGDGPHKYKTPFSLAVEERNVGVALLLLDVCNLDLKAICHLIRAGGPAAVECLEKYPKDASFSFGTEDGEGLCILERAHMCEQLQVILVATGGSYLFGSGIVYPGTEEYMMLKYQNLFPQRAVQAKLKYLPGVSGSAACDMELLEALADTTYDDVLSTHMVAALVQAAWMQTRLWIACEVFSSFLTVALLCHLSFTLRHEQPHFAVPPSLWIVLFFHFKKSLDELVQHLTTYCYHPERFNLFEFDNLADIAYITAGWVAIALQARDPSKLEKRWMSIFSAMSWLRALYSLRGETWLGPRLLPIIWALKDTVTFFLLTLTCVLAASHAYYNLQLREEPTPAYAALMQVVRLGIFGDFDLFEMEGLDTTYKLQGQEWEPVDPDPGPNYVETHILFYITGLGITVLLMNLLVGVLGQNFEKYQDQSALLFLRARAKVMLELQARPLKRISQWLSSRFLHNEEKDLPDEGKDSSGNGSEPSCTAHILYRLCFGPLIPLFAFSENTIPPLVILSGIDKRRYGSVLLLLCSPLLFILSTCLALILMFLRLLFQMQLSGIFHMAAVSLGCCGEKGDQSPKDCHILLVIRAEVPTEDLRSEMKTKLEELQSEQKTKLEELQSEQKKLTELVKDVKDLVECKGRKTPQGLDSSGLDSFATSEELGGVLE